MIDLIINLLERLGIFAMVFLLIMRFDLFRRLLTGHASCWEKLFLSMLFGLFGIAGTYMGVPIQNAIANSRVIGVALGGILGGPLVGGAAGMIAGIHRYLIDIGGFTGLACGVATVLEGLVSGLVYHRLKKSPFDPAAAFICGLIVESLQMLLLLIIPEPFSVAAELVRVIGVPMILINSFGLALFVLMIDSVFKEKERSAASQANTALNIALRTLPYLRGGLTLESANETARIILEMTDLDAVAISDETNILANVGTENLYHRPGTPFVHTSTKTVLTTGRITIPMTHEEIGCAHTDCRLGSAIIVPLIKQDKTIGTLQMFRLKEYAITALDRELANGLAHLFSNQLEISALHEQRKLVREAEIRALQAQIKPHFLFNAINTIISTIRIDPDKAVGLLVKLADFFRSNISPTVAMVPLASELEHCRAYVDIESARFEERVRVDYDIDDEALPCILPPLTLQPLVENALKHGILVREEGGRGSISAHRADEKVYIEVCDDGVGMDLAALNGRPEVMSPTSLCQGSGVALNNINARLIAHFGTEHALRIESAPGRGASVKFTVPWS